MSQIFSRCMQHHGGGGLTPSPTCSTIRGGGLTPPRRCSTIPGGGSGVGSDVPPSLGATSTCSCPVQAPIEALEARENKKEHDIYESSARRRAVTRVLAPGPACAVRVRPSPPVSPRSSVLKVKLDISFFLTTCRLLFRTLVYLLFPVANGSILCCAVPRGRAPVVLGIRLY